jgi:predicted flavoprotein YhiN
MNNDKTIPINMLPDKSLEVLLEKYIEKSDRYKNFRNEELDRSEKKVIEIMNELNLRKEHRSLLDVFINKY